MFQHCHSYLVHMSNSCMLCDISHILCTMYSCIVVCMQYNLCMPNKAFLYDTLPNFD